MIEDFAKLIPADLLSRSGSVFYSGRNAFVSARELYVLGTNPGGDPALQADETVRWHTNKVLRDVPDDWSAYRDESWAGSPPGSWGMQPRMLHLFRQVGLPPGEVPASNIVFLRSRREAQIDGDVERLKKTCWPFHQRVIDELEPRAVLCLGRMAGAWVRKQLGATRQVDEFVENNKRRWKSRSYATTQGITVVVATHPSIADWTSPAADPSALVVRALA